jgi:hypothetical protein
MQNEQRGASGSFIPDLGEGASRRNDLWRVGDAFRKIGAEHLQCSDQWAREGVVGHSAWRLVTTKI